MKDELVGAPLHGGTLQSVTPEFTVTELDLPTEPQRIPQPPAAAQSCCPPPQNQAGRSPPLQASQDEKREKSLSLRLHS